MTYESNQDACYGRGCTIFFSGAASLLGGLFFFSEAKAYFCVYCVMHTELCRCLVLSPSCGLYSFRTQNQAERLCPVDHGISREGSPTCIPHEGAHTPQHARSKYHTQLAIYMEQKSSAHGLGIM